MKQAFYTEPEDQSGWFYHRWLLGETKLDGMLVLLAFCHWKHLLEGGWAAAWQEASWVGWQDKVGGQLLWTALATTPCVGLGCRAQLSLSLVTEVGA